MIKVDAEKLIAEVEKRPALWDMRTAEYSDRNLRKLCWDEICNIFATDKMSAEEECELGVGLQKKWKHIRDSFSRELHGRKRSGGPGGPSKAPYKYAQQLEFIKDIIESKETSNSARGSREQQPDSEDAGSSSNPTPALHPRTVIEKRLHTVEERVVRPVEKIYDINCQKVEKESNRYFLMSLLPTLSSLPKMLNSRCRLEIMQVLNKYEEYAALDTTTCQIQPSHLIQTVYQQPKRQKLTPCTYQPQMCPSSEDSLASNASCFSEET